ncbi:uncharacterized protein CXorf65 homolog [Sardina pilchardus]|uniref:uncharacterized protein CXorf65 homolog n=1 Tax=Sardina pilchardus TaxID=27697 RepID=UPI002E160EF6
MFVYIKHGDGEQFLTNTNCPVMLLLQFIRAKLGLLESDLVDLCDERGVLKLLFLTPQPQESASRLLPSRCTFTVCSINRQSDGSYASITPQLVNPDPALLEALQTQTDSLEKARLKQVRTLEDKRSPGETPTQVQATPQAKGKGKNVHMDTPDEEPQRRTGSRRNRN